MNDDEQDFSLIYNHQPLMQEPDTSSFEKEPMNSQDLTIPQELKRQNKVLRSLFESISQIEEQLFKLTNPLTELIDSLTEEKELREANEKTIYEDEEDADENTELAFLRHQFDTEIQKRDEKTIDLMDSLRLLNKNALNLKAKIKDASPPSKWSFFRESRETLEIKQEISSFLEGVKLIYDKSKLLLVDHDIEIIDPLEGETFDPTIHRALEKASNGRPNSIHSILRLGYRKKNHLYRSADVIVNV